MSRRRKIDDTLQAAGISTSTLMVRAKVLVTLRYQKGAEGGGSLKGRTCW